MKLFQKLLLTPAVLGLFAPIAASASEANLMDVSSYSQVDVEVTQDTFKPLSKKNPLLAGGEGLNQSQSNDFDVDSFSATTTADFSSNFYFGSLDKDGTSSATNFVFDYGVVLTSNISENDSLAVELEAGNAGVLTDIDATSNSNILTISGISYTKQFGDKLTVFMGSGGQAGSTLYDPACAYGGQTEVLEDCGVRVTNLDEGLGTAFGAKLDIGSGFSAAFGYEGQNGTKMGIATKESTDAFGGQLAYAGDNFGVALGVSSIENHNATTNAIDADRGVTTSSSVSAYYQPDLERFPSISVGMESTHDDSAAANADKTTNYFVGVQFDEVGQGSLGAAFGSKAPEKENGDAEKMYEVFYSYNYADGVTITPLMYVKENKAANVNDETGIFLKTSFNF